MMYFERHAYNMRMAYDINEIMQFLGIERGWDVADLGAGEWNSSVKHYNSL
ncbi:MAG: hypothetical protein JRN26_05635 [Nitrososphaerota archaeon]|jgi:hypothetical protein|nr:hypothetical protein [Nitrososphaerota archaeon]MDG6932925.1 hypothetical protein [Nitrososphaerota archaeon]MDG6936346.1 hypothetical protein [Nitrososphaerota archaeon]MDG6943918.1 hypothetical protein [Nitrososphaerota archaeon]